LHELAQQQRLRRAKPTAPNARSTNEDGSGVTIAELFGELS
jgi:hypothetical protein